MLKEESYYTMDELRKEGVISLSPMEDVSFIVGSADIDEEEKRLFIEQVSQNRFLLIKIFNKDQCDFEI